MINNVNKYRNIKLNNIYKIKNLNNINTIIKFLKVLILTSLFSIFLSINTSAEPGSIETGIEEPGFNPLHPVFESNLNYNVNLFSGAFNYQGPTISIPGRNNLDINFQLSYSSASAFNYYDNGNHDELSKYQVAGLGWKGAHMGRVIIVSTEDDGELTGNYAPFTKSQFAIEEKDGTILPFIVDEYDYIPDEESEFKGILLSDGSIIRVFDGDCPEYGEIGLSYQGNLNDGNCRHSRVDAHDTNSVNPEFWMSDIQKGTVVFLRIKPDGERIYYSHFVGSGRPELSGDWVSDTGLIDYADFDESGLPYSVQLENIGYYAKYIYDTNGNFIQIDYHNEVPCNDVDCWLATDRVGHKIYNRAAETWGSPYIKEIRINGDIQRRLQFFYDDVNSRYAKLTKIRYPTPGETDAEMHFEYSNNACPTQNTICKNNMLLTKISKKDLNGALLEQELSFDYYPHSRTGGGDRDYLADRYRLKTINLPLGGIIEIDYKEETFSADCGEPTSCNQKTSVVSIVTVKENIQDPGMKTNYHYHSIQDADPNTLGKRRTIVVSPGGSGENADPITITEFAWPYGWNSAHSWKSGIKLETEIYDGLYADFFWYLPDKGVFGEKIKSEKYFYTSVPLGKVRKWSCNRVGLGCSSWEERSYTDRKALLEGTLTCNHVGEERCTFSENEYFGEVHLEGISLVEQDTIQVGGRELYDGVFGNIKNIIEYGEVNSVSKSYYSAVPGNSCFSITTGVNLCDEAHFMLGNLIINDVTVTDNIITKKDFAHRSIGSQGKYYGVDSNGDLENIYMNHKSFPTKNEKYSFSNKLLKKKEIVYDELHVENEPDKFQDNIFFRRYTHEPRLFNHPEVGGLVSHSVPNMNPTTEIDYKIDSQGNILSGEERVTTMLRDSFRNVAQDTFAGYGVIYKQRDPEFQNSLFGNQYFENRDGVKVFSYTPGDYFLEKTSQKVYQQDPSGNGFTHSLSAPTIFEEYAKNRILNKVVTYKDFSGNPTKYKYDLLGRLIEISKADDPSFNPSKRIIYSDFADPYSVEIVKKRLFTNSASDLRIMILDLDCGFDSSWAINNNRFDPTFYIKQAFDQAGVEYDTITLQEQNCNQDISFQSFLSGHSIYSHDLVIWVTGEGFIPGGGNFYPDRYFDTVFPDDFCDEIKNFLWEFGKSLWIMNPSNGIQECIANEYGLTVLDHSTNYQAFPSTLEGTQNSILEGILFQGLLTPPAYAIWNKKYYQTESGCLGDFCYPEIVLKEPTETNNRGHLALWSGDRTIFQSNLENHKVIFSSFEPFVTMQNSNDETHLINELLDWVANNPENQGINPEFNSIKTSYDSLGRPIETTQEDIDENCELVKSILYNEQGNKFFEYSTPIKICGSESQIKNQKEKMFDEYIEYAKTLEEVSADSQNQRQASDDSNDQQSTQSSAITYYKKYDALNRLEKFEPVSSEGEISYVFGGTYEDTSNQNNIVTRRVLDSFDKTTQIIEDFGGRNIITSYVYDELGRLKEVHDSNLNSKTTQYDMNSFGEIEKITSPDAGITDKKYHKSGKIKEKVDSSNIKSLYLYDSLGRLVETKYYENEVEIQGFNKKYIYDSYNNLDSAKDVICNVAGRLAKSISVDDGETIEHERCYDIRGRIKSEIFNIDGSSYEISYEYDRSDNLVKTVYPDETVVDYKINDLEQIEKIFVNGEEIVNTEYTNSGKPDIRTYNNNVVTDYNYNAKNLLANSITTKSAQKIFERHYGYDFVGRLTSLRGINYNDLAEYTYDELNRLTGVTDFGYFGHEDIEYQYDNVGNRRSIVKNGDYDNYFYESGSTSLIPDVAVTNRLARTADYIFTYNNKGFLETKKAKNTIGTDPETFIYSPSDNLIGISYGEANDPWSRYWYDAFGNRIVKKEHVLARNIDQLDSMTVGKNGDIFIVANSENNVYRCNRFGLDCTSLSGLENLLPVRDMYFDSELDLLYIIFNDGKISSYYLCGDGFCESSYTLTSENAFAITGIDLMPISNLVLNPSFEQDNFQTGIDFVESETGIFLGKIGVWAKTSTLGLSNIDRVVGDTPSETNDIYSFEVDDVGSGSISLTYLAPAQSYETYTCSAFAKRLSAISGGELNDNDNKQDIWMWFFDSNKEKLETGLVTDCDTSNICTTATQSSWTRYSVTRQAPENTAYVSCFINSMDQEASKYRWDGFQIEKSSTPTSLELPQAKLFVLTYDNGLKLKRFDSILTNVEAEKSIPLVGVFPKSITMDIEGNIWIANTGENRIEGYSYNLQGSPIGTYNINKPSGISVDEFGNKYVITEDHVAYKVDPTLSGVLSSFGVYGEQGDDNKHLSDPIDIITTENGIYIADLSNSGRLIQFADSYSFDPSLTFYINDKDGNLIYEKKRQVNTELDKELVTFKTIGEDACNQPGGCTDNSEFVYAYCEDKNNCVFDDKCYSHNDVEDIDATEVSLGICKNIVGNGMWFDCDFDANSCGTCDSRFPENFIGCSGSACFTEWKVNQIAGGEYGAYGQSGCCGDDFGEYYTTGPGGAGCCNKPGMEISPSGFCRRVGGGGSPLVFKGSSPMIFKASDRQHQQDCDLQESSGIDFGLEC